MCVNGESQDRTQIVPEVETLYSPRPTTNDELTDNCRTDCRDEENVAKTTRALEVVHPADFQLPPVPYTNPSHSEDSLTAEVCAVKEAQEAQEATPSTYFEMDLDDPQLWPPTPNSGSDEDSVCSDSTIETSDDEPDDGTTLSMQTITMEEAAFTHLAREEQDYIRHVLERHDIVASSWEDLRPSEVTTVHHFTLTDYTPIHFRPRRIHPHYQEIVRQEVERMLEAGVIRPVESEWAFPILLVGKPDGSVRFCVDFRRLNEKMHRDNYPLPHIEDILDGMEGARVFSTIDLFSGYWQVRLSPECSQYATFICHLGTFAFQVTPYGLRNAPATFQRMMCEVFQDLKFVRVYMDDIVVFSKTMEEHLNHLAQVFARLSKKKLKIKLQKCDFAKRAVRLLGHIISKEGINTDPAKIETITAYPRPQNISELRRFLGLASYYRRFIRCFADLARPLYRLTSPRQAY